MIKTIRLLLYCLFLWALFLVWVLLGTYANAIICILGSIFGLGFKLGKFEFKINGFIWLINEQKGKGTSKYENNCE